MRLSPEVMPYDKILTTFAGKIKANFSIKDRWDSGVKRPVIYIFLPELMEPNHSLTQYVQDLESYVTFRIFSKKIQIFNKEQSSLTYGSDLYSLKSYEEMRKHCYWQFNRKSSRENGGGFFGFLRMPEQLKLIKNLANEIPLSKTAFGCFKISETVSEYAWFYPVHRSLGKIAYNFVKQSRNDKEEIPVKPKPPAEDPLILKIFEDLKPKESVWP